MQYSYVDFTWMIIGVKIRAALAGEPAPKFDDYYYSSLMDLDAGSLKLEFFGESTIINIIESQWRTTQDVQ